MRGVSVIICCYNSSSRLIPTLNHLAKQEITRHIRWEIVVVNNSSTDNTAEVAIETWKQHNVAVPLYIVDEPVSGLR